MIRMFVRHSVADFPRWKKAYDAFDAERKTMGVTGHAVYQTVGDPNEVTAWHDFQSEKAAHAFAESARLREVMASAGVVGSPDIWFAKPA